MKELTPDMLGNRTAARKNSTRDSEEIVRIPLDKIKIRPGFNVREDFGDLEGLAKSLLENGQRLPGIVDVLQDGTFWLVEGERRFRAWKIVQEQQGTPVFFRATVNTKQTTEVERIMQMFVTQDNKQLTANEISTLLQRLVNMGYTQSQIAEKIGKTAAYVSQMLNYAKEAPEVRQLVSEGKVSVSTVLKVKKEIPSQTERTAAIKKQVEQSEGKPVTAEDITDKKKNAMDRVAAEITEVFQLPDGSDSTIKTILKKHL